MRDDLEVSRSKPPVLHRLGAGVVLIAAAALAVWLIIGVIKTIVLFAVVIAAVVAIAWAVKTLVW